MLTNLGDVTETLKTVISETLRFDGVTQVVVTALPPDTEFAGPAAVVSVHLFHVTESPEFKNRVTSSALGPIPIQHAPMGLILQYAITVFTPAVSDPLVDDSALKQHRIIGVISRALHDFPLITEKTSLKFSPTEEVFFLDPQLDRKTKLELILRPAPMEETLNFWSTEDKRVPRLMLFVEARIVVLEPKPPQFAPGIVLSVGQFVFTSSEPQLVNTRSVVRFKPPGALSEVREVRASPARPALFDADGSAALADLAAISPDLLENNRLFIDGTGLGPGRRFLLLRIGGSTVKLALDQPVVEQPADNVQWQFSATSSQVSLRVFRNVVDVLGTAILILPGLYGVRVLVEDDRVGDRPRPRTSNELSFMVTPQIRSVQVTALRTYELRIVGDYLVGSTTDVATREIEFSVAGSVLTRRTTAGALASGEFRVVDSGPDKGARIDFVLPTDAPAPSEANPLAVRLVVNGATATPAWITAEAP
ncbi:MAG TPA: Pvc16 family protein [Polyangiaceae bacterium]